MGKQIPFVDLGRIHRPLKTSILARLESILDRSAFVLGQEVAEFEEAFARYVGSKGCVGVNSGLDALQLALEALGIGPGDEVITAANTFIATAYGISQCGAQVVLVDVEEDTYNLDPERLERAITPRTRAIIPVHLYGQSASMGKILEIARRRGLRVIEDAAQAHGAKFDGRVCGSMGDVGCFSFYPGKNLGSIGEGGAIVSNDEKLLERAKILRNVGQRQKYLHSMIGHNSRLHTVQAAVLLEKLPHLEEQNSDRARSAERYGELLRGIPQVVLPKVAADRSHVFHLYVIQLRDPEARDRLQKHLADRGVQTGIHYPIPIHLSECYRSLGLREGSFPVTERLARSVLSLPIFPGLTGEEIQAVCEAVREFFRK